MQIKNLIKEKNTIILLFLVIILLAIPSFGRASYFNDLAFESLKVQNSQSYNLFYKDNLVLGGRYLVQNPYDFVIITSSKFLNLDLDIALPFILGIISLFLLKKVLENKGFSDLKKTLVLYVFVFSPIFIFTFTLNNYYSFVIFLNLLGIYLFSKNKTRYSSICYFLLVFFGVFDFIISLLILYLFSTKTKDKIKNVILVPVIAFFVYLYFLITVKGFFIPATSFTLKGVITELGSLNGIGMFTLILAISGWLFYWRKNKKVLFFIFLMFIVSLSFPKINYFIYPLIALLGGLGINVLFNQKWKLESLKNLTLFIFFLGMLFSVIAYETRILEEQPSDKILEGLNYLAEEEDGVVFSHHSRGLWIEIYSNKTVLLDSNFDGVKNLEEKQSDTQQLFHTYDLSNVKELFKKYNIKYVVVDIGLKNGLVWEKENQELLYLLTDKNSFRKIYSNSEIDIWEIIA